MSAVSGTELLNQAKGGDFQAFARFLTWLEKASLSEAMALDALLLPAKPAFRLGITGPPGAGKSTLVGKLITELRGQNLKIGVMAVDPSSPFSNGAILGDRIRYSEHFLDPGVFIRSLGTRGSLGGLSSWEEIWSHTSGLQVFLAEMEGTLSCWQADFKDPLALIIGGEAEGPSPAARTLASQQVFIPMVGNTESLNAGIAGAILLFEVVRQRHSS